ncbi:S49 family peptidase [Rhodovulum imhoffii]|nr:S49 family peptidase [Rhodovulum imhoffii]MBK5933025.1 S49 family peptidase [Rhodovulum imhoffii]
MQRWFPFIKHKPRVSVVRLSGVIAGARIRSGLSDAGLAPVLERAFRRGRPAAVALIVNSPGGSPAQSSLIARRIRRLADAHAVPVHAFVEDVAASGGYYLACAADEVWVDENSILGSIGVISAGFGFHELLARHGVERRVYTAGESKNLLDPFLPEKTGDVARIKALQAVLHTAFIAYVKGRRGATLAQGADLFSGDVWVGQQAVDLGLADGVAHMEPKMKEIFGEKVKFVACGVRRGWLSRLGVHAMAGLADEAEARLMWARYGL